jgi:hypothetical protein
MLQLADSFRAQISAPQNSLEPSSLSIAVDPPLAPKRTRDRLAISEMRENQDSMTIIREQRMIGD